MLPHNLSAMWAFTWRLLLVLILPLIFHLLIVILLDQLTRNNIKVAYNRLNYLGYFIVKKITLICIWCHLESFFISRYCTVMWGILWYFWLGMLESIKSFSHIIWHGYIHISFALIPIYCQSEVIMTLPICWNYIVIFEWVNRMVWIIFAEIFYSKIIHR